MRSNILSKALALIRPAKSAHNSSNKETSIPILTMNPQQLLSTNVNGYNLVFTALGANGQQATDANGNPIQLGPNAQLQFVVSDPAGDVVFTTGATPNIKPANLLASGGTSEVITVAVTDPITKLTGTFSVQFVPVITANPATQIGVSFVQA
jgi:hypothetical protein